jgi:hypothetical protein
MPAAVPALDLDQIDLDQRTMDHRMASGQRRGRQGHESNWHCECDSEK